MLAAIFAKKRVVGKLQEMHNLFDRTIRALEPIDNVFLHRVVNPLKSGASAHFFAHSRKIFRGDIQPIRIPLHIAWFNIEVGQ